MTRDAALDDTRSPRRWLQFLRIVVVVVVFVKEEEEEEEEESPLGEVDMYLVLVVVGRVDTNTRRLVVS